MAIEVKVYQSYKEMSEAVAKVFVGAIKSNPRIILGLATGSTVVGAYQALMDRCRNKEISFKDVTTFNLDEYVGLSPDHKQSFHYAMKKNLFSGIDINNKNTHVPEGNAKDLEQTCAEYEAMIQESGGIQLQLLGIGSNGHIGFNEPGSACDSRTHIVDLDNQTIKDNSRFFDNIDDVPKKAITMGIGTILEAKKIVLIASGLGKARAVAGALRGDSNCPACCLATHPDVTFYLDKDASSLIS